MEKTVNEDTSKKDDTSEDEKKRNRNKDSFAREMKNAIYKGAFHGCCQQRERVNQIDGKTMLRKPVNWPGTEFHLPEKDEQ